MRGLNFYWALHTSVLRFASFDFGRFCFNLRVANLKFVHAGNSGPTSLIKHRRADTMCLRTGRIRLLLLRAAARRNVFVDLADTR
jgi:hypothetical protein